MARPPAVAGRGIAVVRLVGGIRPKGVEQGANNGEALAGRGVAVGIGRS